MSEGLTADTPVVVTRRYALAPLRDALVREGRSRPWLMRQLGERVGIQIKLPLLYAYLNGYARVPRNVLSAACWIAGAQERAITERIADEAVLFQQPAKAKQKRQRSQARRKAS